MGRIKRLERFFKDNRNHTQHLKELIYKIKKPSDNSYIQISLKKEGKAYWVRVHRLVASAFIPNPFGKPTVNHKNGIKYDNRVENLEWATYLENNLHSINILGKDYSNSGNSGWSTRARQCLVYKDNILCMKFNSISKCLQYFNIRRDDLDRIVENGELLNGFKIVYGEKEGS